MPPDVDRAFWVDEGEGEFKGFAIVESDPLLSKARHSDHQAGDLSYRLTGGAIYP